MSNETTKKRYNLQQLIEKIKSLNYMDRSVHTALEKLIFETAQELFKSDPTAVSEFTKQFVVDDYARFMDGGEWTWRLMQAFLEGWMSMLDAQEFTKAVDAEKYHTYMQSAASLMFMPVDTFLYHNHLAHSIAYMDFLNVCLTKFCVYTNVTKHGSEDIAAYEDVICDFFVETHMYHKVAEIVNYARVSRAKTYTKMVDSEIAQALKESDSCQSLRDAPTVVFDIRRALYDYVEFMLVPEWKKLMLQTCIEGFNLEYSENAVNRHMFGLYTKFISKTNLSYMISDLTYAMSQTLDSSQTGTIDMMVHHARKAFAYIIPDMFGNPSDPYGLLCMITKDIMELSRDRFILQKLVDTDGNPRHGGEVHFASFVESVCERLYLLKNEPLPEPKFDSYENFYLSTILDTNNGDFSDVFSKVDEQEAMEATSPKKLQENGASIGGSVRAAYKTFTDNAEKFDTQITKIIKSLGNMISGDEVARTEIIEGKNFTFFGLVKKVLSGVTLFSWSKVGAVLIIVTRWFHKKGVKKESKRKMIMMLEEELAIVNEKIDDARGDGNRKAKYALMRTKAELENALKRLKYGYAAEYKDNDAISNAARAVTNAKEVGVKKK